MVGSKNWQDMPGCRHYRGRIRSEIDAIERRLDRDIAEAIRHELEQAAWESELLASLELLLEEHHAAFRPAPAGAPALHELPITITRRKAA